MSGKKRGRKPSTKWIVVGYDENGTEVARVKDLTFNEAERRVSEYPRAVIASKDLLSSLTKCGVADCNNLAIAFVKPHTLKKAVPTCRYHSAGVYIRYIKGTTIYVKNKLTFKEFGGIAVAPDHLCIRYCPAYYREECRAYLEAINKESSRKLIKGFRGMVVLCREDPWWRK